MIIEKLIMPYYYTKYNFSKVKIVNKRLVFTINLFLLIITFIFLNIISIYSQTNDNQSYFLGVGYQYSFESHSTTLKSISANPSCCIDDLSGEGNTDKFNLNFIYKSSSDLNLGINFGYNRLKSNLYSFETELINVNGNLFNGEFKHNLDIDYSFFNFGLFYPYFPIENLFLTFGAEIQYLSDINYHQKEEITFPIDKGVFQDSQTRTRNEISGKIGNVNKLQFQVISTMELLLPLNRKKNWYLAPHVDLSYRFTEIFNQSGWTNYGYGIGISLKYRYR